MDPLTHLLDGPRARNAFALRVVMSAGWSIAVQDRAPLTLMVMLAGSAWLVDGDQQLLLKQGEVVIVRGPAPYLVTDDPARTPDVLIHPGQRCTSPTGRGVLPAMDHGVRTWGNAAQGSTSILIGTYETDAEVGMTVARTLPRVAVVPARAVSRSLLELLAEEMAQEGPGQGSVLDRLLDVVLVHSIRAWAGLHPAATRGWLAGSGDPLIARVLALVHNAPGEAWTLEGLARRVSVSRATLASRFGASVGEPPMSYLRRWRMLLASELLADPHASLTHIADTVGYGSPFALSTAFKKVYGVSPSEYRSRANRGPAPAPARPTA